MTAEQQQDPEAGSSKLRFQYGTFQQQQQQVHQLHQLQQQQQQHRFPVFAPIAEEIPLFYKEEQLPFCGLGLGWLLFFTGFFCVLPWFVGSVMLCFLDHDPREKQGLSACSVATFVALLVGFRFV